jgi:hypothetical protein
VVKRPVNKFNPPIDIEAIVSYPGGTKLFNPKLAVPVTVERIIMGII